MQEITPQRIQAQKKRNLNQFPALGINLTQDQINGLTHGEKISKMTAHQKTACRVLAEQINWHPMYIADCCPQLRPPLLCDYGTEKQWVIHCKNWQAEHDSSIEDLVEVYKIEFERIADRLFEPLDRHSSGVTMSAHDNTDERYPCAPGAW